MSFQYIFKGQTHTNTDREYMLNIGMDTEQIESVLQQQEYELAAAIIGEGCSTMTDAEVELACRDAIDQAAGNARVAFISKGLLIEEEYRLAKTQAEQWIADGKPSKVPDAVQSWAEAADVSPEEAANDIAATAQNWELALASVRQARLTGKAALSLAGSRSEMIATTAEQVSLINDIAPSSTVEAPAQP